jgi:hypothetical protein
MSAKVKPENFKEVIIEFTSQLAQTFPEYLPQLAIWYDEQTPDNKYDEFFKHCLGVYPERMMDILYKNEEIFDKSKNPKVNTEFVPQIYFCDLFFLQGITEKTKNAIWKYLQIILFLCLPKVDNNKQFGDMGDVFAMMNDDVLNGKMTEIFTSMFENMPENFGEEETNDANPHAKKEEQKPSATHTEAEDVNSDDDSDDEEGGMGFNPMKFFKKMPKLDDLKSHMSKLFGGKLGTFAKQLADELNDDVLEYLGDEYKDVKNIKDAFQVLSKNPKKMMGLMKLIQEKLAQKIKNGDISQDDILKETESLFETFKDLGSNKEIKKMMKSFGMNADKNTKVDLNAMQRNLKYQQTKERLKKRFEEKQAMKKLEEQQKIIEQKQPAIQEDKYDIDEIIKYIGITDKDLIGGKQAHQKAKKHGKK